MFFAVPSAIRCASRVIFLSCMSCHVFGDATMALLCAVVCFLQTLHFGTVASVKNSNFLYCHSMYITIFTVDMWNLSVEMFAVPELRHRTVDIPTPLHSATVTLTTNWPVYIMITVYTFGMLRISGMLARPGHSCFTAASSGALMWVVHYLPTWYLLCAVLGWLRYIFTVSELDPKAKQ